MMGYRRICVGVLASILGAGSASTKPQPPVHEPTLTDFAVAAVLHTQTGASLYEMYVPLAIYEAARQQGLADVRVFNANGESVPMGIALLGIKPGKRQWQGLAAYPLDVPLAGENSTRITLYRNAAGRIEFADVPEPDQKTERHYIVDATRLQAPYQWLDLNWSTPRQNFVYKVALDGSDDLNNWASLNAQTTIANLRRSGGKVVRHQRIEFPATSAKYLRVRFLKPLGAEPLPNIVSGNVEPLTAVQSIELETLVLEPQRVSPGSARFEFSLPFGLAMRHLTLHTTIPNAYVSVRLWNRMEPQDRWRQIGTTTLYNLSARGSSIRSSGVDVTGATQRLWAFEPHNNAGVAMLDNPSVEVSWQPHILVFVARGPAPFTLAFGSAKRFARHIDAQQLLHQIDHPAQPRHDRFGLAVAVVGEITPLAGVFAYETPLLPISPRQWTLWAMLILAVLVLLWMAWTLIGEKSTATRDEQ
jgi:hypothetical protein